MSSSSSHLALPGSAEPGRAQTGACQRGKPFFAFLTMEVWGVTRVHARSSAAQFLLQIWASAAPSPRRKTSRVSFLMCPFSVRAPSSILATYLSNIAR